MYLLAYGLAYWLAYWPAYWLVYWLVYEEPLQTLSDASQLNVVNEYILTSMDRSSSECYRPGESAKI